MTAPVTMFYAALLGLLLVFLSLQVVRARWRYRVRLGTGSDENMERAVRVQANFAEYVPLGLLLLYLAETGGAPAAAVHAAGLLLLVSRVLHAAGLSRHSGRTFGRFWGTAGTWFVLVALSLLLLWLLLRA